MSDIEIAQNAPIKPISEIAARLDIPDDALAPFGHTKAKVSLEFIESVNKRADGKLILVTAITPTPAGEGKTTTSVGLTDGLNKIGKKAMVCLREPSLGPCFGMKGGAAGGGYAQVIPMEDINLHFTGDFHAITSAHNLLSALIDNHIYWGNEAGIDTRRVAWRRVVDMNDRSLRHITSSLGGAANGYPREDGFDITVASEVMAIFCLAKDAKDLEQRLGQIVIGYTRERVPVRADAVLAPGPMTVLLKDALAPNLVQTLEHNPAFIHGGPFANIAHGCNSVIATRAALKLADYVVTEAGFGADLGAEKFFDIKCRSAGLSPDAVVLVATVRALKMHGGVSRENLGKENVRAVADGCIQTSPAISKTSNFSACRWSWPSIVSAPTPTPKWRRVREVANGFGVKVADANHWAEGGAGAVQLAKEVVSMAERGEADFRTAYPDEMPLWDKIKTVATRLYRADDITADQKTRNHIQDLQEGGFGNLPVCIAKTQYSFSTDPNLKGAPSGHILPVRGSQAVGRGGVCGGGMRRHHDHARPAANAGREPDSPQSAGRGRRVVLGGRPPGG